MASLVRMGEEYSSTTAAPASWREQDWAQKLPETIERGAEHLLSLQVPDGYWQGELEADSKINFKQGPAPIGAAAPPRRRPP